MSDELLELVIADRDRRVKEIEWLRTICPLCGHKWSQHDPEDGKCDSMAELPKIGRCDCGRDPDFHRKRNAELSCRALAKIEEVEDE